MGSVSLASLKRLASEEGASSNSSRFDNFTSNVGAIANAPLTEKVTKARASYGLPSWAPATNGQAVGAAAPLLGINGEQALGLLGAGYEAQALGVHGGRLLLPLSRTTGHPWPPMGGGCRSDVGSGSTPPTVAQPQQNSSMSGGCGHTGMGR